MKIYLDTIGCRLNQSEIETYARQYHAAGHILVPTADQADLVIINTCTVTAQAAADSRQKIRQAAHRGAAEIVVTGCWATMEAEVAAALPRVSQVIPNLDKDRLVPILLKLEEGQDRGEQTAWQPLPGAHHRTRAFIKVQDGCDNRCTYCITCLARGPSRSRQFPAIRQDVESALAGGCQEIVLTGVHLGAWGADLHPRVGVPYLIRRLLSETQVPRLRLSSLEPWDIGDDFFDLWQDPYLGKRLCRHLHLPLQSGCAATLQRMARKTTPQAYATLVGNARKAVPGIAITTDVIVGFPGESEAEFSASRDFIDSLNFARGHVFVYSPRPGTAAARLPGQVPHQLRKQRSQQLRELFAAAEQRFHAASTGQRMEVLWESAQSLDDYTWQLSGLTDTYIRVTALATLNLWNQISLVELVTPSEDGMQGIIYTRSERDL
jgi:threonylcarbamoyladenosine tRNA methylthiotransferase MtaB